MDAFALLKQRGTVPPDLKLVLAGGKGWLFDGIFEHHAASPIRDDILLPGFVPDELLPAIYSAADVLAFPSLYEGFGLPILEAMACGTPVVASRASCLPEVAEGAALLIDPTNVDGLTVALELVLLDAALRARLIDQGRERAARVHLARAAEQLLERVSTRWPRHEDRHQRAVPAEADHGHGPAPAAPARGPGLARREGPAVHAAGAALSARLHGARAAAVGPLSRGRGRQRAGAPGRERRAGVVGAGGHRAGRHAREGRPAALPVLVEPGLVAVADGRHRPRRHPVRAARVRLAQDQPRLLRPGLGRRAARGRGDHRLRVLQARHREAARPAARAHPRHRQRRRREPFTRCATPGCWPTCASGTASGRASSCTSAASTCARTCRASSRPTAGCPSGCGASISWSSPGATSTSATRCIPTRARRCAGWASRATSSSPARSASRTRRRCTAPRRCSRFRRCTRASACRCSKRWRAARRW